MSKEPDYCSSRFAVVVPFSGLNNLLSNRLRCLLSGSRNLTLSYIVTVYCSKGVVVGVGIVVGP